MIRSTSLKGEILLADNDRFLPQGYSESKIYLECCMIKKELVREEVSPKVAFGFAIANFLKVESLLLLLPFFAVVGLVVFSIDTVQPKWESRKIIYLPDFEEDVISFPIISSPVVRAADQTQSQQSSDVSEALRPSSAGRRRAAPQPPSSICIDDVCTSIPQSN